MKIKSIEIEIIILPHSRQIILCHHTSTWAKREFSVTVKVNESAIYNYEHDENVQSEIMDLLLKLLLLLECIQVFQTSHFITIFSDKTVTYRKYAWLDGAEVSALGWGSGGPRFQSHPRLTFQSCSRFQLNHLGSEAPSESTFKKSNTCGVSNTRLYFLLLLYMPKFYKLIWFL